MKAHGVAASCVLSVRTVLAARSTGAFLVGTPGAFVALVRLNALSLVERASELVSAGQVYYFDNMDGAMTFGTNNCLVRIF